MPLRVTENFVFGGVDSRSNPANFRVDRALRCINFEPQPGGWLQLRRGFTNPPMSVVDTFDGEIHSACYYETIFASVQYGPSPPFAAVDQGGANPWSNPSQAELVDGLFASISLPTGQSSNVLYLSNFSDLQIPEGAVITKVQVDIKGFQTIGWQGRKQNYILVQLTPDGTTTYPVGSGAYTLLPVGANTWNYDVGQSPLWGAPSLTADIINAGSFGILIKASVQGAATTFNIDGVRIIVEGSVQGNSQPFVLYGQAKKISALNVLTGQVFSPSIVNGDHSGVRPAMGGNEWGFFRANGKIFWNDGQGPLQSFDGITQRAAGIRAPTNAEAVNVTVTDSTSTIPGSMSTTSLGGYQLFMAYQNPATGHVGNRIAIGSRVNIANATDVITVTGLPDLTSPLAAGGSVEWNIVIGKTNDGGDIPYWFTDANGNRILVTPGQTTATFFEDTVDFNGELPEFNDVPSPDMDRFCNVLNTIFGSNGKDYFIRISNNINDATSGNYVGRPEESWPGDQIESFPTGEAVTCLASYNFQGWFYSRNHLAQYSESLVQAGSDPWLGPWPVGCCGKRGFVETPYGPFWVTGEKELATFGYWGPVSVSEEYERALLAKIGDAYLPLTEISYVRDSEANIDRVEILGFDTNGNPVYVIHDFKLREQTNMWMAPGEGQGYARSYPSMTPSTFVRNSEAQTYAKDANGKTRLWAGATDSMFHQLEDGNADGTETTVYSGDYIGLIPQGAHEPRVAGLSWFGDPNVSVSYAIRATSQLTDFVATPTKVLKADQNLFEAPIGDQGSYLYMRLQLDSHPADGNFDLTDPPQIPMNPYGVILGVRLKQGAMREEVRR